MLVDTDPVLTTPTLNLANSADTAQLVIYLRAMIDNLPDPVWLRDAHGTYLLANRHVESLYGLSQGQIVGHRAADILSADEAVVAEDMDRRALESHTSVVFYRTKAEDVGVLTFEITTTAIHNPLGELIGVLGYAKDITQSRAREEALAASLREQQLIFEHTSVGIVFVRDHRVIRVNAAFCQIFGITENALLHQSLAAVPTFQVPWPQWHVSEEGRAGTSPTITSEQVFIKPDGSAVTCTIYARALNDDDEKQGMVYALIDVSVQSQSETKLAAAEGLLGAVIEHLPSVVVVRDADTGTYVHFSRSAENMVGRQREEVVGKTPFELYPQTDAEEIDAVDKLVMQTRQQFSKAVTLLNQRTGKTSFIQRTTIPILDGNDKIRYVMNLGEDITDRISIDRALRESEARFRQFAVNVDQALFSTDPGRTVWHFQNDVIEEILGVTRRQLAAQPDLPMRAIIEEDREALFEAQRLEELLQRVDVEFRVANPSHGTRWVRMRTVSSRSEAGEIKVFGTMDDVTERKQSEQERIERVMQQRNKLVQEVHHRIKNNLQGIVGLLHHSARAKPDLTHELKEVAGQISAIAQVHGLQTSDQAAISVVELVKSVVLALSRAIGYEFKAEIDPILRDWALQEAEGVACALVINELAANAAAHGKGECGLKLYATGQDVVVIEIWNSGLLPDNFDNAGSKNRASGLGLIRALVPRKGGSLSLSNGDGIVRATLTLAPPAIYRMGDADSGWEA
jgi:PAS domain S-box-containing protein